MAGDEIGRLQLVNTVCGLTTGGIRPSNVHELLPPALNDQIYIESQHKGERNVVLEVVAVQRDVLEGLPACVKFLITIKKIFWQLCQFSSHLPRPAQTCR